VRVCAWGEGGREGLCAFYSREPGVEGKRERRPPSGRRGVGNVREGKEREERAPLQC
jgi:hypothetical protein